MAYTTIDDPSAYFQALSYSGAGGSSNISRTFDGNSDLQPDLTWHKSRGQTYSHYMFDSTRGVGLYLSPNLTVGDDGTSGDTTSLASFDSDGFTLAASQGISDGSAAIACWGWKANGGTTASNSTGDITTTVQTDSTSGFSIITYTGNNTDDQEIGHGLGAVPGFAMFKSRAGAVAGTGNWVIHHQSFSGTEYIFLTSAATKVSTNNNFKSSPTNSIFTLGNSDVNESEDIICYAWAPIQGYSKFGSYTGNNNADGTFVYTGFKPAWLLIKNSGATGNWRLYDNKRSPSNVAKETLVAQDTNTETNDNNEIDFLSNGFKCRATDSNTNGNGTSHIYAAFAEQPFVSSEGVPCTAR